MPKQPRTSTNKSSKVSVEGKDIKIPYASGFKPPNASQRKHAIGFGSEIPAEFDPSLRKDAPEFFPSVPEPTSVDDWLAQYAEEGQTFRQFLRECPWLSSRKRKYMSQEFLPSGQTIGEKYPNGKVYIVQVGDFSEKDSKFYDSLLEYTSIFLGLPVVSLPQIQLEVNAGQVFWVNKPDQGAKSQRRTSQRIRRQQLTSRYSPETEHLQVCVDSNLMKLRNLIPNDAICMVGLTMLDLYGDETDLFVAGMAAGNQRVAVFSLYRYDPCLSFSTEHWFQIETDEEVTPRDRHRITLQRGCKLLVHEICHLLGIDHCIFYDCCMNGSGHLKEDFRQPMHLCPVDLRKLHTLVGFSVLDRYRQLLEFYKSHGFREEASWVEKRMQFICQ